MRNQAGKQGKGHAPSVPAHTSGREKKAAMEVTARGVTTS
jgi:hypothetical protein